VHSNALLVCMTELLGPSNDRRTPQDARPPQDTISSDILGTTKIQGSRQQLTMTMNQCKAITSLRKFKFDVFNFT